MFGIEKDFQKLMEQVYGPLGKKEQEECDRIAKELVDNAIEEVKKMTEEIDISKVLIEGDTATIMGVKYKRVEEPPKTLTGIIWKWWEDVFTTHEEWDAENAIEELVNRIELFLPKEQSAAGSQNVYVESAVEGFNDCLNKIKRKLR